MQTLVCFPTFCLKVPRQQLITQKELLDVHIDTFPARVEWSIQIQPKALNIRSRRRTKRALVLDVDVDDS